MATTRTRRLCLLWIPLVACASPGVVLVTASLRLASWEGDAPHGAGGEHFAVAQRYRCLADGAIDARDSAEQRSYLEQLQAMDAEVKPQPVEAP